MNASPLRGVRAAFVFMTRVPVGGFPYSAADWGWARAHFPLVGLAIGALQGAVLLLTLPLGTTVAATLSVLATVWVTGAFHEDGLADTADALGCAHGTQKLHEILKDSRIGTYGALALCLSVLLRVAAVARLSELPRGHESVGFAIWFLLPLVHGLARTGPVALMAVLPYTSGEAAKGSSVVVGDHGPRLACALGWGAGALATVVMLGLPTWVALLLTCIATGAVVLLALWFRERAGGFTGDFLGATEQVLEISLLLGLLASAMLRAEP